MQVYRWQARKRNGERLKGRLQAANPQEVAMHIQAKDCYVTSIKPTWAWKKLWPWENKRRMNLQEIELFFRQLGILLDSGVHVLRALDLVALQASATVLRVDKALHKDLENGLSFSIAMRKYPDDFSPLVIRLVEAGEASGNLPLLFKQLAQYHQGEREVRKTIFTACLYPGLVLISALLTITYFLFNILPVILELYEALNLTTGVFFLTIAALVENSKLYGRQLFGLGLLLMGAVYHQRHKVPKWCLKLPYLSTLYQAVWEVRCCRILSLLLSSGITLVQSLQMVTALLPTAMLRAKGAAIGRAVLKGMPFSKAVELHSGLFHALSTEFIALGEENGSLAEMLREAANILEDELAVKIRQRKIVLEPFLVLSLTALVGSVIYFLMTPIYGLVTEITNYN